MKELDQWIDKGKALVAKYPELPFVLPFAVFILITGLGGSPEDQLWLYPLKTALATILLILFLPYYAPWGKPHWVLSSLTGFVIIVIWIGLDPFMPTVTSEERFRPDEMLSGVERHIWLSIRVMGAALVVPVLEEVFWRVFLPKWIINVDFDKVETGRFTLKAFLITVVLFGLEHHRWVQGMIAGVLFNLLMMKTKSLNACIIAHAVANFLLAMYVLQTGEWQFW